MADLKFYDVIERPVITEKTVCLYWMKRNILSSYTLKQQRLRLKMLLKKMFEGAKVASVNTMNYDGKPKKKRYVLRQNKEI